MQFNPHDYQRFAIDFIKGHTNAAVFLDMGLGKTVITLTALDDLLFDSFEVSRVLVVCPLRVAKTTWPQEIAKWDHLRHLRYSVVVGTPKERVAALGRPAELYIINRENVEWLVKHCAGPIHPRCRPDRHARAQRAGRSLAADLSAGQGRPPGQDDAQLSGHVLRHAQ